ncbi:hypothetical protein EIN_143720 [Entamoeba invadens IP1]|uniref:Uncharacterized protein n=1 Tax=Entamoeba invadens IP1 TaxID=370355 RepID=A0A0A1U9E9_ENTIV|nr:hypothetical protein EIN_143720 [Entamoeba invadens IP1]ELP91472.1 hypothetical protein EIN_143720 [Entamoeba invadens IP1]|eukprot:XP_004258243.1 hypothetical protein EIN_143720 [Entamoeba invadens IP1]
MLLYVFYFNLFIFIFLIISVSFLLTSGLTNKTTRNDTIIFTNKSDIQMFHNYHTDLRNFNYSGKCGEVFQYPKNSKRDLWLTAYSFNDNKSFLRLNRSIDFVLGLANSSISHATKKILLMSPPPFKNFEHMYDKYGISIELFDAKISNSTKQGNSATRRMFAWKEWLYPRRHLYDRVFISDLRDIYIFGDIFATFSENDLLLQMQCLNNNTNCFTFNFKVDYNWMKKTIGVDVANAYRKNNTIASNVGTILGGTNKVLGYLQTFIEYTNFDKWDIWGYDQSLHNWLIYSRKLDFLKPVLESCSQRMCYEERYAFIYDKTRKMIYTNNTKCSPVMRHKIFYANEYFKLSGN